MYTGLPIVTNKRPFIVADSATPAVPSSFSDTTKHHSVSVSLVWRPSALLSDSLTPPRTTPAQLLPPTLAPNADDPNISLGARPARSSPLPIRPASVLALPALWFDLQMLPLVCLERYVYNRSHAGARRTDGVPPLCPLYAYALRACGRLATAGVSTARSSDLTGVTVCQKGVKSPHARTAFVPLLVGRSFLQKGS